MEDESAFNVIVMIVIGVFLVVGHLVKRALQAGAAEGRKSPGVEGTEGEWDAGAQQVRQFLQDIARGRRPPTQAEAAEPAAPARAVIAPKPEIIPPVFAPPLAVKEAEPTARLEPLALAARPPRRRRPRARRRPVRRAAPAAPTPARHTVPRPPLPIAPRLVGSDLKNAVLWLEILGPPVSARRRGGHRPPTLQR